MPLRELEIDDVDRRHARRGELEMIVLNLRRLRGEVAVEQEGEALARARRKRRLGGDDRRGQRVGAAYRAGLADARQQLGS